MGLFTWLGLNRPAPAANGHVPPAGTALSARGLCKSFGSGETRVDVVKDATLDLVGGEVALLMGPAGSGKSTLLAMLSGLLKPDCGAVTAMGKDLWSLSARGREEFRRRHTGFVFQGANLLPALSARGQLELVLHWAHGVPGAEARRRALELLEHLGMERHQHSRPAALSGGEKQRVAIARALVKQPDLLFADEPTSALDWEGNGKRVARLLRQAAREYGTTVLIVSHDPRLLDFADRVLHMDDGRLSEPERRPAPAAGESGVLRKAVPSNGEGVAAW